jgi:hypothetical protein
MSMRRPVPLVAILPGLLLAWLPGEATAQSAQRLSIQASGLYAAVLGDAYDGLDNGPGFEIQLRYTPAALSVGGGIQLSLHSAMIGEFIGYDPTGGPFRVRPNSVNLAGVFIEPRYVLDVGSASVAPYISARLAGLQYAQTVGLAFANGFSTDIEVTSFGVQVNGGGGVLLRLSPRLNLDLGASFGQIWFEDAEIQSPDLTEPIRMEDTSGTGQNAVFRIGLAIGLGR